MFTRLKFSILALLVLVLTTAAPTLAQGAQVSTLQIHTLDDSDYPNLRMSVSALDSIGQPVADLDASDFSALEDGVQVSLLDAQPIVNSEFGIAVVLAIDVSTSMAGVPIETTKQSAITFIDNLGENDTVAVVAFANVVQVVQDFTSDRDLAKQAVSNLNANGQTALFDGAFQSVVHAGTARLSRRMVVLLSDANEFGELSLTRRGDAFLQANESGIPVYTIALGSAVDQDYMEELATLTGGKAFYAPTAREIAASYQEIAENLRSQYLITVQVTALADEQTHVVTVRHNASNAEASRTFGGQNFPPQITLDGMLPGAEISEPAVLSLDVVSQGAVIDVSYTIGGQELDHDDQPPYSAILDPHAIPPGERTLTIQVRDSSGNVGQGNMPFSVPSLPPTARLPVLSSVETLTEALALEPQVAAQSQVAQVTYLIDGSVVYTTEDEPYRYTLNPADLPSGPHTMTLVVTDETGQQGSVDVPFEVGRAPLNLLLVGLGVGGLLLVVALLAGGAALYLRLQRPLIVQSSPAEPPKPPSPEVEAWLKIDVGGNQRGETFPLGFERATIGRSPRCDFVLDDTEHFVSRYHAAVWLQDGSYHIEDNDSSRGTLVNGRKLQGQHRLSNGDEIRLANYILIFHQLVYKEDLEETMHFPLEELTQDATAFNVKTDPLDEQSRREQGKGGG